MAFYAVPKIVFGKLSAQLAECFNSFMLSNGIRNCAPLKILELLSTKLIERCNEKFMKAVSRLERVMVATKSGEDGINVRTSDVPGMNMFYADVNVTAHNIIGRFG